MLLLGTPGLFVSSLWCLFFSRRPRYCRVAFLGGFPDVRNAWDLSALDRFESVGNEERVDLLVGLDGSQFTGGEPARLFVRAADLLVRLPPRRSADQKFDLVEQGPEVRDELVTLLDRVRLARCNVPLDDSHVVIRVIEYGRGEFQQVESLLAQPL